MKIIELMLSSNFFIIQIIGWAYIGALFGEINKKMDNEKTITLKYFIGSWIASGFCGVIAGFITKGIKDNEYLVLGICTGTSFLGRNFAYELLTAYIKKALKIGEKKNE